MVFEACETVEAILEAVPSPFAFRELRGDDVVHVADNRAAALLLGRTPSETRGRSARELGMSGDQIRTCASILALAHERQRTVRVATRYETPDGMRDLVCHATPMPPGDSRFACFVEDQTDLRQLENAVEHAERLTSLGTLTAGIVHDMAGPATACGAMIEHCLTLVARAVGGGGLALEPLHADLLIAQEAMQQLVEIMRTVRGYSQAREVVSGPCDINEIVESALRMARADLRSRVRLTFDRGEVPSVVGSAVRLGQVVLNLVSNAARAAGAHQPESAARVRVRTDVENRRVRVQVFDNGEGLPSDAKKLFEPFATRHGHVGGTGLGLFISKRIVESFGGTIVLANNGASDGGGAVATVLLVPASDRA